jgi:hypothetical protein
MLALAALTLATLASATPLGARLLTRAEASRINWRGANGDQNMLGACGRGPVLGHGDGDRLQMYVPRGVC